MRTLAIVCFCLCLIAALTPAVSAVQIIPINATFNLVPAYNGHLAEHAIDGDDGTWAEQAGCGSSSTNLQLNFDNTTSNLSYCTLRADYGGTYIYSGHTLWKTYSQGIVRNGTPQIIWINDTKPTPFATFYIGGQWTSAWEIECFNYEAEPLVADFNATPLYGQAPLYVAFQDTSTGGTTPYTHNWTISPPDGLIGNYTTSEYPTIVFTQNGNYTISHCVDDGSASDCEEKTDYIWVYNSTATATTTFWAVDPLGHRVWDSAISLQDVQNTSWTNTSSPSGGVATITSLIGHTINGYATAAGYNDGETLGIPADGVSGGIILMTPTNITNVSAGYVSLYVYVKESVGNAPISGAYVNLAYAEGATTRNDGSTTSTEGVASFVVPNNTLIYIYGEKAGYTQVSTTKDSGTGSGGDAAVSVILYMTGQTVTPTVTATTGPGGTVPVTVDPRTPQEKESDIALILIDYGDMLVMFFIALTVIGGVKMIMK